MNNQTHIVFYDDSCPLCNAEIDHYKKIKAIHDIKWLGIHSRWNDIKDYGLSKETLLRRIHAVHANGSIISGAAVFVLIWKSLRYYHWLGKFVTSCRLVTMLDYFYKHFAAWRYKNNQSCKIG